MLKNKLSLAYLTIFLISFSCNSRTPLVRSNVKNLQNIITRSHNTDQTFKELIKGNHITVIKSFVTWCRYCDILSPIFEETAQKFKTINIHNKNINIQYLQFDADQFPKIKEQYNARPYPRLLYFYDGKLIGNTQRPLTSQELMNNIKKFAQKNIK